MSRHNARITALQMLFQLSVGKNSMDMAQVTLENASVKGNMADFAKTLVDGVLEHQVNLDQYIEKFTKGWGVNRLYVVDRLILEIAMYEMKFTPETPAKIVIDEALEIAKIYGTDNSKAFINGVLDNFYHKVILEDSPDYKIDENLKQRMLEEEVAQALKMEEVLAQKVEEAPVPKVEALPITEEFKGKSFRKIKKETIKEEDKIKPEVEEEEKRPWNADFIPYITRMTPEENAVFAAEKRKKLEDEKNGVSNPFDDKKPYGDKKFGDKPKFDGERKPYGDKPKFDGERKPYGDKPKFDGERKSFGDKKPYGDKPRFGDKPKYDGEKKFDKKPYDKPKFDKK